MQKQITMKSKVVEIELKTVTKNDLKFLYELLAERDPIANISHKKMPTYGEHVKFVMSKPYTIWQIIYYKSKKAGSVYLTNQNEIGIFLKKNNHGKGIGSKVLKMVIERNGPGRYLANISPKNKKSIEFFKNNGFKLIQHTYEFTTS